MTCTGNQGSQTAGDYTQPQYPEGEREVRVTTYKIPGIGFVGGYHSACVLDGKEHSFGGCDSGTGVYWIRPETAEQYNFKERIIMGTTKLSVEETDNIVREMARSQDWQGTSYHLTRNNCNHFASQLCWRLTGKRPPVWINKLAKGIADGEDKQARRSTYSRMREASLAVAWLEQGKPQDFNANDFIDKWNASQEAGATDEARQEYIMKQEDAAVAAKREEEGEGFDDVTFRKQHRIAALEALSSLAEEVEAPLWARQAEIDPKAKSMRTLTRKTIDEMKEVCKVEVEVAVADQQPTAGVNETLGHLGAVPKAANT